MRGAVRGPGPWARPALATRAPRGAGAGCPGRGLPGAAGLLGRSLSAWGGPRAPAPGDPARPRPAAAPVPPGWSWPPPGQRLNWPRFSLRSSLSLSPLPVKARNQPRGPKVRGGHWAPPHRAEGSPLPPSATGASVRPGTLFPFLRPDLLQAVTPSEDVSLDVLTFL